MPLIETVAVESWLYDTLSDDAALATALGVLLAVLPDHVRPYTLGPLPAVFYAYQAGSDDNTMGGQRFESSLLYQVKVVGEGQSLADLEAAARRIDDLLQGASAAAAGGGTATYYAVRENIISYPEDSSGKAFRHLGGVYRFTTGG